jgi:hypothetical protein
MDRNTVVRIAIPLSLYESVKGKVIKENENASGWQIYSSEGKYPNIKYEPVNDKVYKTEDEAKHIASIINKQYPNSRVYVKPAGSIKETHGSGEEAKKLEDPEYVKKIQAATEKAMKGDTKDLALLMFPGLQEAKKPVDAAKKKEEAKKAADIKKKKEEEAKKAEAEKKKAAEAKKKAKA